MLSRESVTMKTAVVCWGLFSIAFALPIAPHTNPLRKPEIEQAGSHSADVNHDTKEQKDTLSAPAQDEQLYTPDSFSSDENDDKPQKDAEIAPTDFIVEAEEATPSKLADSHSADVSPRTKAQKAQVSANVPESRRQAARATPTLNSHSLDAADVSNDQEDPLLLVTNDDSNEEEISHVSDVNANAFEPENDQPLDYDYIADDPEDFPSVINDDPNDEQLEDEDELVDNNLDNDLNNMDTETEVPAEEI